jgi:hypothetical protein
MGDLLTIFADNDFCGNLEWLKRASTQKTGLSSSLVPAPQKGGRHGRAAGCKPPDQLLPRCDQTRNAEEFFKFLRCQPQRRCRHVLFEMLRRRSSRNGKHPR